MKTLRVIAFLCACTGTAFSQSTVTVSGHLITGSGGTSSSNVSVLWELINDSGQICRVSATGIIVPTSFTVTQAQLAAGISLIPNNLIACGSTLGVNRWRFTVKAGGIGTRQCSLNITGNTNLDSVSCLNALPTTPIPATGDSLYARIDGTNAGFTGPISGTSATFSGTASVTGLTSLKNLEGIRFAADFALGSTTCGIQEAYNALPANGGEIVIQSGNCSASGWPVTIQKPILLVGQGMGGPTDPGFNANVIAGSSLTNTSTGSSFFVISLGAGTSVEGVTFKDFAMIGNKQVGGSTAGDCVDVNGGTTAQQVRALLFENIHCNQPKGSGWVIKDNTFMITFLNVHTNQSGSHCYVLQNGPNAGVNSQIHFIASVGDMCGGTNASFSPGTADGWNISGSTSRGVDITDSTLADSNNGVNVVAGAVNVQLHVTNNDFETNTTCDINLNDGFGHKIIGNTLRGTGVGARGICTNFPAGAATQLVQLLIDGNEFDSHLTQDVTIGATTKNCFIQPQAQNNYTYSDASNNCVKMDSNTGGSLTFAGASGFLPATNGTVPLGSAGLAWSAVIAFDVDATTYRPRATGHMLISDSTPTISAGFGTGASVISSNGPGSFAINVGTGGTASSGTIGLPASFGGWNCWCEDQTTTSATVNRCKQTNGTASSAIIGNFNTTPAAAAWVASDILTVSCLAR